MMPSFQFKLIATAARQQIVIRVKGEEEEVAVKEEDEDDNYKK